ncbi:MAG: nucleotidyltransferase [Anaerolineaceae bacterium]|nr:MAG: nucleotidyltransferase [Anaerolineaceae bacterium]
MSYTTLVIMAAGMGSRYGGIKQLEAVGPNGEIIMDYSIYDAICAGFNKVVIIIRKDLEKDFREIIGNRIEQQIKVEYVFQEPDVLPSGFHPQAGRTKPWGTGHAVLCCKDVVHEPFAVINADDYYGKEAFQLIYNFLNSDEQNPQLYCMAGFILGNTLSENGTVTRGVCESDKDGWLINIIETSGIIQENDHAKAIDADGNDIEIDLNSVASMNMWGFKPSLFDELEKGFKEFLSNLSSDDIKKEYLLPDVVGDLVSSNKAKVKVLKTSDRWFGVTYKEDKASVIASIKKLIDSGAYPNLG